MNNQNKFYQKLFSIKDQDDRKKITVLGVKISINRAWLNTLASKKIQDSYDLKELQNATELTVFLIPNRKMVSGGLISIFYLHKFSKELNKNEPCILCTYPGKFTIDKCTVFQNDEQIYRWEQIIKNGKNLKKLIVHIPEYYSKRLYKDMKKNEIAFLKSIPDLRINILNQNIDLMPSYNEFKNLLRITSKVTIATGFERFTTQKTCDDYKLPLYYIPSFIDLNNCIKKEYSSKKKIILYSPDDHPMKATIIQTLQQKLPEFELREIHGLTYKEFLEVVADAQFCISFGEGFDGYYIQPYYAKSIGVSVYNDTFFVNKEAKSLPFVYESYEELNDRIVRDIKNTCQDKEEYEKISQNTYEYFKKYINKEDNTIKGLKSFYDMRPTFVELEK